jgi:hypothetical protein
MTIYSDGVGNKFLGDCIYANHNLNYPTIKFLQAFPKEGISAELALLCDSAGLQYRDIYPQNLLLDGSTAGIELYNLIAFGTSPDSINDRYAFIFNQFNTDFAGISDVGSYLYNNSGFTGVGSGPMPVTTNNIARVRNREITSQGFRPATGTDGPTRSNVFFAGVTDGFSLALFYTRYFFANNPVNQNMASSSFYYAGTLADVNTGFNYYSENIMTRSILFSGYAGINTFDAGSFPPIAGGHRINNVPNLTLQTGDARYPIVCADAQTPTSQWATDFYVFHNSATLGYPAMGRVRNLLLAEGSYTLGKVVKIQGTAMPDAGQNSWLPVGTYAGKVVLMRCYTSVPV